MTTTRPTSTRILRSTLAWSAIVMVILLVAGGLVGYLVAGTAGMVSALVAVALGMVSLSLTGASILIANRWYGQPLFMQLFFAIVMGGWLLKFIIFLVALFIVRDQPWLQPTIFLLALVASVIASLVIDVVVMLRMRVPYVGETTLPTENPEDEADLPPAEDTNTPGG